MVNLGSVTVILYNSENQMILPDEISVNMF